MADSPFRGYRSLEEVRKRIEPLADWTRRFKPEQTGLTLSRADYDLIRRWPEAAHCHEIEVTQSGVWFRGLELTYDNGPKRYERPAAPQQEDIEGVA